MTTFLTNIKGNAPQTFLTNIHPSFLAAARRRGIALNADVDMDAEFERMTEEVNRIEGEMAKMTPEWIAQQVQEAIEPYLARLALKQKQNAVSAGYRVNSRDEWAGYDLNAQMEQAQ